MRKRIQKTVRRTPFGELRGARGILGLLLVVSGVVNILALTGSFYMMQVYDRALTSQSVPTLVALSIITVGLFLFHGALDYSRTLMLSRVGGQIDASLAPLAHKVTMDMPRYGFSNAEAAERGRDIDVIRQFLSGQGPIALFDLPWLPVYLAFIYILHPWLCILTFVGALVLTMLTLISEWLMQKRSADTQKAAVARAAIVDSHSRNAEVIRAMGFTGAAVERFEKANQEHLYLQSQSSTVIGVLGGVSKVVRMILQSAVLGLGAYLTIKGDLTGGAIMAASVASGRALAPVDLAISQWKSVVAFRRSYARASETLTALEDEAKVGVLPAPVSDLKVEKVTVVAPTSGTVVLSEVSFELKAGQGCGIIGPSGGGKSSLVRGLTGVWPALRGNIRLDSADISQWSPDVLGQSMGYLPQEVSLMDGTVAQNIARFNPDADFKDILAASKAAGVHELVLRLQDGYETHLGPNGAALSAGQRQRIGLARALFGNPFLVVLDEPNSNLDAEGEQALSQAILGIRARRGIVIVVAHRPSALANLDMIGVVQNGRLSAFGPKAEILSQQLKAVPGGAPAVSRPAA